MSEETQASEQDQEQEKLEQEMKELEENPPEKLEDWPDGKLKYKTFGGTEADAGYDDGATEKLGPSEVRHFSDGTVTVHGEEVDNPEDYKGEPIPGGPTDPNAPDDPGMVKNNAEDDTDDSDSDSGSDDEKSEESDES
jgi:hypothetical protein